MSWWIPPLLALQFLTRIPAPGLNAITAETAKAGLAKSVIWFPVVGGLVGVITAATLIAADHIWPRIIAVILALIVEARLTGAFHEDAVADFCDGFGGGMTPQRIHEIMKDSRIGSYGTLSMGFAVALRAALLFVLPDALILPALIGSASFGRYLAVCLMAIIPPLMQTGGLAKDVGARTGIDQWFIASLLTLPFMVPLGLMVAPQVCAAIAAALIFALWFRRFLLQHLNGVTGDCLGFGVYVGQILILLAANTILP
ncbi:adenosylcobinamide-GDP ribazoletransferase [Sphingorhabdus sp.]|uniref:adenosylcobinamide-GDP ribazoletransferase n=1 Tax=Sphingorhabdus sp. TaxID=1902408 RepID=UPI0039838821